MEQIAKAIKNLDNKAEKELYIVIMRKHLKQRRTKFFEKNNYHNSTTTTYIYNFILT